MGLEECVVNHLSTTCQLPVNYLDQLTLDQPPVCLQPTGSLLRRKWPETRTWVTDDEWSLQILCGRGMLPDEWPAAVHMNTWLGHHSILPPSLFCNLRSRSRTSRGRSCPMRPCWVLESQTSTGVQGSPHRSYYTNYHTYVTSRSSY